MKSLDNLIQNLPNISLIDFFKFWEDQKDIFMLKHDGGREEVKYTMLLLGNNSRFDMIRVDCSNIQVGLEKVLKNYKDILSNLEENKSTPS